MNKGFESDIDAWLEEHGSEVINMLKELVSIKSVKEDPVTTEDGDVYPFGSGVQDAFAYMLAKAEADGFITKDVDHYGGHIDLMPNAADQSEEPDDAGDVADNAGSKGHEAERAVSQGDKPSAEEDRDQSDDGAPRDQEKKRGIVGVIGHLDTVPEGDGWINGPFSSDEEDGYIIGRGTTDDKGPLLAAYFAMKALKNTGNIPYKRIRLILGLDEETDWEGVKHYFDKEEMPEYGFTPDAYFPVLNGEKGIMSFKIAKKLDRTTMKGLTLRKFSGGNAVNMVPANARAVVNDPDPKVYDSIREKADAYAIRTGSIISTRRMGKSLEIAATGESAHGSTPEEGVNAISALSGFLAELNFVNDGISDFFDFYRDAIGKDTTGKLLGVDMSDNESGALTLNVGVSEYDGKAIGVKVDIRYPVTKTSDEVYDLMMPKIDEYGLGVLKEEDRPPIYFEKDKGLVRTCLDCYRDVTGDKDSEPLVIGGGTYARACKGFVAFGGMFPGDPDLMHKANEKIEIKRYLDMIRIYAAALYRLADKDFLPDGD